MASKSVGKSTDVSYKIALQLTILQPTYQLNMEVVHVSRESITTVANKGYCFITYYNKTRTTAYWWQCIVYEEMCFENQIHSITKFVCRENCFWWKGAIILNILILYVIEQTIYIYPRALSYMINVHHIFSVKCFLFLSEDNVVIIILSYSSRK